ncbi:MAG: UDP-N-acetylmuramoyl-L-alanyl-D-glutamate--2,6-diaminopimelate ligase [Micavibrio sp.]|nr:UDP-N-acetylmuramoyl-L-alanyl-D-glutamate--2,6-diaminopimelate ligase [Micavibrio sp.]|tara:strand:+ start:1160 stop:2611 length:1452 start_codon:yes stop_codon:yes gene_type:complete
MGKIDVSRYTGLAFDSRIVEPGFLFAAFPGSRVDGRDYISAALSKGAKAVLAPVGTQLPDDAGTDVDLITDENPRRLFSLAAAEFYARQPKFIAAVTGTNGKTSTATFTRQIWAALGYKCASMGTLGVDVSGANVISEKVGGMTTPDPVSLYRDLQLLQSLGVEHLAMEASSHGLDQARLDGVRVRVAGFTSFSRDHMDYHPSEAEYLAAKTRLFSEVTVEGGIAVLNADIPEYEALKKAADGHGLTVWSYGEKGREIKLNSLTSIPHGQKLDISLFGENHSIDLPLAGRFQAYNALCALGFVLAEDKALAGQALKALGSLVSVPGRLQRVSGHPSGAAIYIDYAHTPDAIETVLKAIRPHVHGKLVCIFGCGGDRDAGKRPLMGKAAAAYADIAIVTDDNPRSEDPAAIRAQAAAGAQGIVNIEGRSGAIRHALELLEEGDVLVIAGKGHEQGQEIAGKIHPFCDTMETKKHIQILKEEKKS